MIELGDFVSKSGWINKLETPKKLREKHVYLTFDYQHNTYKNALETGGHFNPLDCPHPYHAGDMPPLFSVNGNAFLCFMTDRFKIKEVLGKAVIIHSKPDDFTTQPSGNAAGI